MTTLTLERAACIVDAALRHGRQLQLKPLTVAVLDAGGHLLAFKREDRSGILRPEIAQAKAWGALGMGLGSRALAQRAMAAPAFFVSLASTSEGRLIPVPGGVLIRGTDGEVLGAVGISGDHPDQDEACGVFGVENAGLTADPGDAPLPKG
jgi:uncharacterized protein GlcG (DUF336 family)